MAEQEGLSFREAEWVVGDRSLFGWIPLVDHWVPPLVSYLTWDVLVCSITRAERGRMYVLPGPPRQCKRTQFRSRSIHLHLIGYHTFQKELRDVYHSVYLLNRAPGFPSCGEVKRRRAIQEILSFTFGIGCKGRHPPLSTKVLLKTKENQLLCQHMRQPYRWPTGRSWRLPWPCKATKIDLTMSWEEERGPIVRVETGIEHDHGSQHKTHSPEAGIEHWSGSRHRVWTRSPHWECALGFVWGPDRSPKLEIIVKLIPKLNRLVPKIISRNPQIRGLAPRCLKMGIWQQRHREPSAKLPIKDLESWLDYPGQIN